MVMPKVFAIFTMVDLDHMILAQCLDAVGQGAVPYYVVWRVLPRVMYITWVVAVISLSRDAQTHSEIIVYQDPCES